MAWAVPSAAAAGVARDRIHWVEIARGLCASLVVSMHAAVGLEAALGRIGFMHAVSDFAQPFRMPTFFAMSGLFLGRALAGDWRTFLDRRVYHFIYFYALWLLICSAAKFNAVSDGSWLGFAEHLLWSCVEPYSTLWFIYALAVFSLATRLLAGLPRTVVLLGAVALAIWPIHGAGYLLAVSSRYYVFFLIGYVFSLPIRTAGQAMRRHLGIAVTVAVGWAVLNAGIVFSGAIAPSAGALAELPPIQVVLGVAGILGVIATAGLIDRTPFRSVFAYIGEHSIVLYLAAFVPAAVARECVVRYMPDADVGSASIAVAAFGIAVSLLVERLARGTPAAFLFVRPSAAQRRGAAAPRPVRSEPPAARPRRPSRWPIRRGAAGPAQRSQPERAQARRALRRGNAAHAGDAAAREGVVTGQADGAYPA